QAERPAEPVRLSLLLGSTRVTGFQAELCAGKQLIPYSMTPSARARIDGGIISSGTFVCTLAAHHYWMTFSARTNNDEGTVTPRALAVLRLTTSSKVVGCWMGSSLGLLPFKILST